MAAISTIGFYRAEKAIMDAIVCMLVFWALVNYTTPGTA